MAASHSSIQARRFAATSDGSIRKVVCGVTSCPKASGSGSDVLAAGIIQLVVGMMFWNAGEIMNYRNCLARSLRSEEHTSELQSLMRISYDVFCLTKKKKINII